MADEVTTERVVTNSAGLEEEVPKTVDEYIDWWRDTLRDEASVRQLLGDILELDVAIDGYTTKSNARQTGLSVHFKWVPKLNVVSETMRFNTLVTNSPPFVMRALAELIIQLQKSAELEARVEQLEYDLSDMHAIADEVQGEDL